MPVDFLPFAIDPGANVMEQAAFAASPLRGSGNQPGIAASDFANKAWRQSAFVAAAIANYVSVQNGGSDVPDDGDLEAFIEQLTSAISIGASVRPARRITASTTLLIDESDYRLAFDRTAALAAQDAQLPPGAQIGQSFKLVDIRGNFNAFPVRVLPPSGTIGGVASFTMNQNKQSAEFALIEAAIWSVETS